MNPNFLPVFPHLFTSHPLTPSCSREESSGADALQVCMCSQAAEPVPHQLRAALLWEAAVILTRFLYPVTILWGLKDQTLKSNSFWCKFPCMQVQCLISELKVNCELYIHAYTFIYTHCRVGGTDKQSNPTNEVTWEKLNQNLFNVCHFFLRAQCCRMKSACISLHPALLFFPHQLPLSTVLSFLPIEKIK